MEGGGKMSEIKLRPCLVEKTCGSLTAEVVVMMMEAGRGGGGGGGGE